MNRLLFTYLCCLTGPSLGMAVAAPGPPFRVAPGFVLERVAAEPTVVFPMFAAFDDRGRLFVAESSGLDLYAEISAGTRRCRIRLLEDRDGDGVFETAHVFADRLVFPMGLTWCRGKLYVADPPDLVALEDTDGDGRADRRTVLLTGFGHKDNGSLHGLTFGPDGLLYMTMGSPDGYRLKRRDGSWLTGESGALIRCRADGTDPEVISRGFENLVEVIFAPRGEAIGTVNWFQRPLGGLRDALVHLVDGGLYPLNRDRGTAQVITGEPLPALAMYPAVALSGLVRYRGNAFPGEHRHCLFSAQHNARLVMRHVLVPEGSTYRTEDSALVSTGDPDFHPSDVLEDADGSLLIVDTGSWYVHHCPTGQIRKVHATGGIYRVRAAQAARVEDPWGLKIEWSTASPERLTSLLADSRPMVCDRASLELSARGQAAVPALAALLASNQQVAPRQRAAWGLTQIEDDAALPSLRAALDDAEPDVAAVAARALGLRRDATIGRQLLRLLNAESSPLRLAAAEALARCGSPGALPAIWRALAGQPDRFLEHALIHAAHRHADADALSFAVRFPSPRVQQAALLLLDQAPRPRDRLTPDVVLERVTAADPGLRRVALQVLHGRPEWATQALGVVRDWLQKPGLNTEEAAGLRSLLGAFQSDRDVQARMAAAVAGRGGVPRERRLLVLEAMREGGLAKPPAAWEEALRAALRDADAEVRRQAIRVLAALQLSQADDDLARIAADGREPAEVRLEAVRALILRRPQLSGKVFEFLVRRLALEGSPLDRLAAAELLGRAQLDDAQLLRILQVIRGDNLVSPTILLPALRRPGSEDAAAAILDYLTAGVSGGWKPAEKELDALLQHYPPGVKDRVAALRALVRTSGERERVRLAEFEPLLSGGDAGRGRAVFFGKKVACAACHRIGNEGGTAGPDLTKIGAVRSGRDILEAIVVPSSTIAQGYDSYFIATKAGRTVSGVLVQQTADAVVLRDSGAAEIRLRKDQIEEMSRQATSLMPDGQERALSSEEFRDLLAFLQTLR